MDLQDDTSGRVKEPKLHPDAVFFCRCTLGRASRACLFLLPSAFVSSSVPAGHLPHAPSSVPRFCSSLLTNPREVRKSAKQSQF